MPQRGPLELQLRPDSAKEIIKYVFKKERSCWFLSRGVGEWRRAFGQYAAGTDTMDGRSKADSWQPVRLLPWMEPRQDGLLPGGGVGGLLGAHSRRTDCVQLGAPHWREGPGQPSKTLSGEDHGRVKAKGD